MNRSFFSLWSFVNIHPQKIFIHISLLQKLNFQKTVIKILSSKHLITIPHIQAVFHDSKSKQGHNKNNIMATRWTKNAFFQCNMEIVCPKIKKISNKKFTSH